MMTRLNVSWCASFFMTISPYGHDSVRKHKNRRFLDQRHSCASLPHKVSYFCMVTMSEEIQKSLLEVEL